MKARQSLFLVACMCLPGGVAWTGDDVVLRRYEITTDTGMPHLEENLRYARRVEKRCMDLRDLSGEFWMLADVSLQDCKLKKMDETPDTAVYLLSCVGGHGTTGQAVWKLAENGVFGTLDVRLGGKNMTFYQRITAKPLGACR